MDLRSTRAERRGLQVDLCGKGLVSGPDAEIGVDYVVVLAAVHA